MGGENLRSEAPTNEEIFDWLHATLRAARARRAWRTLGHVRSTTAFRTTNKPGRGVAVRYGLRDGFQATYELRRETPDSPIKAVHRFGLPRMDAAYMSPTAKLGQPGEYPVTDQEIIRVDLAGMVGQLATMRPDLIKDLPGPAVVAES